MKDSIRCEKCGKGFVIDEVEFTFNKEYNIPNLCPNCSVDFRSEEILKEFKINTYITVKFIKYLHSKFSFTMIFVNDEPFINCKY